MLKKDDNFSLQELTDIHLAYDATNYNGREAARLYEHRNACNLIIHLLPLIIAVEKGET